MKPTLNSPELAPLLAFGAHPDDIEFGCGGVIAGETSAGRRVHFVVCSRGEAGTHGTPKQRTAEAKKVCRLAGRQPWNFSNSMATRIWKFAPPTRLNWQR